MNRTEFIKILKEHGVVFYKNGTRHDIYIHTSSGKKVAIPRHREIKNKFLRLILDEIARKNSI